jgi:SAM-dependent methyltransferase
VNLVERIHEVYIRRRRARVLSQRIAQVLPPQASVLDVGCGDGHLASLIQQRLPGVRIQGVDVLLRDRPCIPVKCFDGRRLPYPHGSFDVVMFNDVLHHADDPHILLQEAVRVARQAIVIKDHLLEGILAGCTLRLMDRAGNRRFSVRLAYNYWRQSQWIEAFEALGTTLDCWNDRVNLYAWPLTIFFDRHLHFVARLMIHRGPKLSR